MGRVVLRGVVVGGWDSLVMGFGSDPADVSSLLRAEHAVVAVLASDAPREEAIAALLPAIGEPLGWAAGALWEPCDGDRERLSCSGTWSAPWFDAGAWELACRATLADAGAGLPGAVVASGQPVWSAARQAGERGRALARAGLDCLVCFPLLGGGRCVGAIEFALHGGCEPAAELRETLTSLGRQIGQYLERCRADAELRRSDAFLRAMLNAAFDAIVTMDAEGNILGVNPAAEELFRRPARELVGQELAGAIIPPSLRDAHRRGLANFIAWGRERVTGHPIELTAMRADGAEFPVEVAIRVLEVEGAPVFAGFIRDLTAQRAAEAQVRRLAEEQAALRRVATLVARGADQATVFAAVTEEVARLSGAQTANMIRYLADDTALVIGAWSQPGAPNIELGARVPLDGDTAGPRIRRTGAPVRDDSFQPGQGQLARSLSGLGFNAAIGAPVVLDGRLWGALILRSADGPFPSGAEHRLQGFAELAAQALANAEAREQLAASRARLVTAALAERRRLERNLHDGAQQRLVSLALLLRLANAHVDGDPALARRELDLAGGELARALSELREIARGLHPAILSDHGLDAAIQSVCGRAPLPVDVEIELSREPTEAVQAAAYYTVVEALTNIAKYAGATTARVEVRERDDRLRVEVSDDGVGGADRRRGSGLSGLTDRVEALGGRLTIDSPAGEGTRIRAELPVRWESPSDA
jgi:PAS domain S-box-containing protein